MSRPGSSSALVWQMPVVRCRGRLAFARPFVPAGRAGASPETSLRGVLFEALLNVVCEQQGRCRDTEDGHPCQARERCAMGWLYQPRCEFQRRDHASPLAINLWDMGGENWEIELRLWGQRAADTLATIQRAFVIAGRAGLGDKMGMAHFDCTWRNAQRATLAEHCVTPNPMPSNLCLRFETPCQTPARDLPTLAGNTAHDTAQWALVDAGSSAALGKRGCDGPADAMRAEAAATLAGLQTRWLDYDEAQLGRRRSRSNRGQFDLKGFVGRIELAGDLDPAWPWLSLLSLRGAGGRGSFGLGRISLNW